MKNLDMFKAENLFAATTEFFKQLGIKLNSNTAQNLGAKAVLAENYKDREPFTNVTEAYFAGLVNDDIFKESLLGEQKISYEESQNIAGNYNGLMIFALKLDKKPTRTEISELTRAFNQKSKAMPVALLLCYNQGVSNMPLQISLAVPERFLYKQSWRQGQKVGKTIILRDIDCENPHRGHKDILEKLAQHNAKSFNELHERWLSVLNINVLNNDFYYRLAGRYDKNGKLTVEGWYQKAFNDIKIDLTAAAKILEKELIASKIAEKKEITEEEVIRIVINEKLKPQVVIRIIIRMMFIWFMKEKGLIKPVFFTRQFAKDFLKNENTYYNSVLHNMFFAVLNKQIDERRFRKENPKQPFNPKENEHGVFDVMRFKRYFKDGKADEFLNETKKIPFINGGLFQCHDYKFTGKDETGELNKNNNYLIDAFSETKPAQVSDEVMFSLIDLFNSYVWTIEESTPEEQDVALDPELLGTIFENLIGFYNPETKENARKQTGSFYTPKEIVEYMCRESFKETLKIRFPALSADIDNLIENNEDKLDFPNKNNLLSAITSLKILDPACGSGAFPMGMFNLMVRTIEKLQEHKTTYKNKLDIIKHCIYGIDIQNIAVEISKLRFFISLLVDYQTPENIADFDVLPNLETKFTVANTLIGIDLKKDASMLFDFNAEFRELTEIFMPFTTAKTPSEKTRIKNDFEKKKREIVNNPHSQLDSKTCQMLADWNPFNVCYCSPFFDSEIMFGISTGFDIVIGNPPYIQMQKDGGALSKRYGDRKEGKKTIPSPYKTFNSMGDIYALFYEKGMQLLKSKGHLCLITSNKWMRAGYGENLRRFFAENTNPVLLLDLGPGVFESATVDVNILMLQKDKNQQKTLACTVKKDEKNSIKDLGVFVRQNAVESEFRTSESWVILSPVEQRIKAKIEAVGTPLKDWDINIYRGVLTGCNEAFIISKAKRKELIEQDSKSEEIIRPLLKGRDIKRYGYEFADSYLITTFPSLKIDIDMYPAVKQHLLSFGYDRLKQTGEPGARKKTNNQWFETQDSISYWEDFYKQKIMYSEIVREPQFYFDKEEKYFPEATAFIMTGEHLDFLYKAFHTKTITYFFKTFYAGGGLGEDGYRYKKKFLENLPIPKPTENIDLENNIEETICELYQLTDEEIKFISSFVNL
jgi:hypothetical protein